MLTKKNKVWSAWINPEWEMAKEGSSHISWSPLELYSSETEWIEHVVTISENPRRLMEGWVFVWTIVE